MAGGRTRPYDVNGYYSLLAEKFLKYGYPPDMQKLATDTVLKQAEMLAEELMDDKV